jgi:PAS domain S-box-containing protein
MDSTAKNDGNPRPTFAEVHAENPRLALVVRIEWTILLARYALLALLWALYATHFADVTPLQLGILSGIIVLQNAFIHFALFTRRYYIFLTATNFIIHLVKATAVVGLVGSPASSLAVLYLMLILGFCLYSPNFRGAPLATVACCAAYAITILAHWSLTDTLPPHLPVLVNFMSMMLAGILVDRLGALLQAGSLETKSHEEALASSEATLRAILDHTSNPIIVYDENGFISDANEPATDFLGISRESLLDERLRRFLFDDGTFESKMATLRARGHYHGELVMIDCDDREHNVDALASSFMRSQKRFFVLMLHDITEQKETDQKARVATLRLEHVNQELTRVGELRSNFYTTVAQRLRSPLSAILGNSDLLLNEELGDVTEEQRKALQSCQRSVRRVFQLVDEALDVAGEPGQSEKAHSPETRPHDTRST